MGNYHIAILHDTVFPVIKYGGTERVIWWLGQALHALGHQVTYIVPSGSTCPFGTVIERPSGPHQVGSLVPADVDIVHAFATPQEEITKPLIVTIGGNGQVGERFHPNTVFVSENHANRHDSENFIYHGLNPDEYPPLNIAKKQRRCYFLAKARWKVKNVRGAIEVAKKADVPIDIMGGYRLSFDRRVKWLGMAGGPRKMKTLEKGSALLFPVRWHEPFGIAIIEALLTGAPVFGTPYGSLKELVPPHLGTLSNRSTVLAEGLGKMDQFDGKACREHVLGHFTHLHMAEKYLNRYEHIINGGVLSRHAPRTLNRDDSRKLLDFY